MNEEDFVDFLAEQGRSGVSALHQFRLAYSELEPQVHIFLEGDEDAQFYLPHLRGRLAERELFTYFCGGKWGVLEARGYIEEEGCADAAIFLIDRDFDDFFGKQPQNHNRTYITDTYAIENILVSIEALEVVLIDLAGVSKADPSYKSFKSDFPIEHAQFSKAIRPLMAWSLAMREAGLKPNFNNADLKKVFQLGSVGWRRRRNGFAEFAKVTCRAGEALPAIKIRPWLKKLSLGAEKNWIRGKYELWFFESYLISRLTPAGAKAKRWSIPTALRDRCLFEVLGARVSPPSSFVAFLDAQLGKAA